MKEYSELWLSAPGESAKKAEHDVFEAFKSGSKGTDTVEISVDETLSGFIGQNKRILENAAGELRYQLSGAFPKKIFHIRFSYNSTLEKEGYEVRNIEKSGISECVIAASDAAGILYGAFELSRFFRLHGTENSFTKRVIPSKKLRMLDHWDNIDGSIERGYSGHSFFYENGEILVDERIVCYARLLASCGYNAISLNNVNVRGRAKELLMPVYREKLKALGEIFSSYNVKIFLCPAFSSPKSLGALSTADPLDPSVQAFWNERAAELFTEVKGFGGFLVKADSEGESGPFEYGRTHADGANMLARAVEPYGGIVIWRCFVYNCQMDWRDRSIDRARAAYDHFMPLDGSFAANVILQIKNGPVDFQIREPLHPLFGALKKTTMMIEFQIAQEYTGQQKDICCLLPMFDELLKEDTYAEDGKRQVIDRVEGICAVTNTGDDFCWTGNYMAGCNLYGFGRMIFDRSLSPEQVIREWTVLMFGKDLQVVETIVDMQLRSREVYEHYTAPLGLGWLCTPSVHYGPAPMGYEFDRWGTYHYADRNAVGYDRTETGSGMVFQYNEPLASIYNDPSKCPEELLLFFHRAAYDTVLSDGKTLIQRIYDTHFRGVSEVRQMIDHWNTLEAKIDPAVFGNVSERLSLQLKNAVNWCDIINAFFYRYCGIEDAEGREIY